MSESLRDQLLKAGLAPPPAPKPERPNDARQARRSRPDAAPSAQTPHAARGSQRRGRADAANGEIDLAKAYALRERTEREARERAQREQEERARAKKLRRQQLATLVGGAALNAADADVPRHFPHGGKIRRIYVTSEQLTRVNTGELAVVQFSGRYLLVVREIALAAQAIEGDALVLLCDPGAADDDGVPADLVW